MDQKTSGADGFNSVRPLTPEELAAIGGGSSSPERFGYSLVLRHQ
jgi:hypothetical protein